MKWLTKVLMDGGSGLNIMYAETLDAMGIDRARIQPTRAPFHGIMSEKQVVPLGQIDLPITFGDPSNYRMETLTFEVVGFHKTYHTILGRPCYTKFMATPNYTYLKLKMPGPGRVITISTSFQHAYECEVKCGDHATAIITSKELVAIKKEVAEEAPDPKRTARSFEPAEGAKEVLIDPAAPRAKRCILAPCFPSNRKARSSTSSAPTETSSHENPWTCQAF
ncbi:uncharacterized protein [Miscanthus floridulus]|uniref:uncharacterized protein n=1 Tax=Miscanthus floridulus TaxID=154761 RepID=UPI0034587852